MFSRKYLYHYLLWAAVTISLAVDSLWIFDEQPLVYAAYVPCKLLIQAAIVYFNLNFLIPRFFYPKKNTMALLGSGNLFIGIYRHVEFFAGIDSMEAFQSSRP